MGNSAGKWNGRLFISSRSNAMHHMLATVSMKLSRHWTPFKWERQFNRQHLARVATNAIAMPSESFSETKHVVYALCSMKEKMNPVTGTGRFPVSKFWHSEHACTDPKKCVYVRRARRMISPADESAFTSKLARQLSNHRTSRGTCDGCRAEHQRTRYYRDTKYNTQYDNQYSQAWRSFSIHIWHHYRGSSGGAMHLLCMWVALSRKSGKHADRRRGGG